jgi:hypothetical protein
MANTIATVTSESAESNSSSFGGEGAFHQLFNPTYVFTGTISDMDAVAATAIGEFDVTITGVALGDMVLGVAVNANLDDGTDQCSLSAHVSATDTVTVQLSADNAEFAADDLNAKTIKLIVGRPNW